MNIDKILNQLQEIQDKISGIEEEITTEIKIEVVDIATKLEKFAYENRYRVHKDKELRGKLNEATQKLRTLGKKSIYISSIAGSTSNTIAVSTSGYVGGLPVYEGETT